MKYNININQTKCIEFWLNLQQWAIMDIMSQLSTWADPISTEQWIYYYLSRWKLIDELPIISGKKNTFQIIIKSLKDKWLLDHYHDQVSKKWYYRLSELWKTFTLGEKNHQAWWKISPTLSEKNHHNNITNNNITNNNIHSLTSNEVNSFINNISTNELLVNKNSDIVEINNKESSFVELNNKNTWIKNSNCKEKENKIKESPFDVNEVFDRLWNFYPWKKNAKEAARTYFKKKIKTQYDLDLLRYALPLYIDTVKDKNYLVLLRTYLSEERYKDYENEFNNLSKEETQEIKQEENIEINHELKFKRSYDN